MAKTKKTLAPIHWEFGTLRNPTPLMLELEEYSKELYGFTQVERVMRGEEAAPTAAQQRIDRARAEAAAAALASTAVGTRLPDMHGYEKVTGKATFPVDVYPASGLYTRVLRSPYPHAKVKRLDVSKAEQLPGVMAVLTPKDCPTMDPPILAEEPSHHGEAVAAVAAVDEGVAEAALRLIEVEYEQLPFVLEARDAMKPGAPLVNSRYRSNAPRDPFVYKRGDAAKGFAEADVIVEGTSQTAWEQHVAMEPHNATALWERDKLTIWTSSQYVHRQRDVIADTLKMPHSKVRLISEYTGGGFGDKTRAYPYHMIAALLAKKAGRPVRYELTRKDVFLECTHNYPKYQELRLGFKRDGAMVALQSRAWVATGDSGARSNADDFESAIRIFKCPNVDVIGYAPYTNTGISGALRTVGEPSGNFAFAILVDQAAEKLNMDPLDLYLKNIEERVDQVVNLPFSSNGVRECLLKAAEAFGWKQKWQGWRKQRDLTKPQRGVGMMAFLCNKGAMSVPMTAVCQIDRDGSVRVVQAGADLGGGQRTTFAMIAAEVLGVAVGRVTVTKPDTEVTSDTGIVAGSRATKSIGSAVKAAAEDARAQLLEGAALKLNVPQSDLDIADGVIFAKADPSKKLTIAEAVAAGVVVVDQVVLPAGAPIIGKAVVPAPRGYSQKTLGAGFFEVEVDPGTGMVKVLKIVQAHDVGKAINPLAVENQIIGGAIQGMGKALTEEMIYDPATGVVVNPNLDDYKLHMMATMPEITTIAVEPIDVLGPFGAKGLGEPVNIPASPCIANAIYDAMGVRLSEIPMTPYRILKAVRSL
ncbi:MAG: xanthine dehydrogenase family protein molybdopterin-binding subunit [Chloroflexi bacterium]|nr:xanthine dehydrogenase family protein molybdopterin-binding subunit [Chloroflexota bacterium]